MLCSVNHAVVRVLRYRLIHSRNLNLIAIALTAFSSAALSQTHLVDGFRSVQNGKAWAWNYGQLWRITGPTGDWESMQLPSSIMHSSLLPGALSAWFFDDRHGLFVFLTNKPCKYDPNASYSCQIDLVSEVTQDAGRTWVHSESRFGTYEQFVAIEGIDFVGATGWVILQAEPGAGQLDRALLQTNNGGRLWKVLSDCSGGPGNPVNCQNAPESFVFRTGTEGYLVQCSWYGGPAQLQLYVTHDGGTTWQDESRSLPQGPGMPSKIGNIALDPQKPDQILFSAVWENVETYSETEVAIFRSNDRGATWKRSPAPAVKTTQRVILWPSMFAGSFGITNSCIGTIKSCLPNVFMTQDAGLTWSKQPLSYVAMQDTDTFRVSDLQRTGSGIWMQIGSLSNEGISRLLYSADNGQHWRLLQ